MLFQGCAPHPVSAGCDGPDRTSVCLASHCGGSGGPSDRGSSSALAMRLSDGGGTCPEADKTRAAAARTDISVDRSDGADRKRLHVFAVPGVLAAKASCCRPGRPSAGWRPLSICRVGGEPRSGCLETRSAPRALSVSDPPSSQGQRGTGSVGIAYGVGAPGGLSCVPRARLGLLRCRSTFGSGRAFRPRSPVHQARLRRHRPTTCPLWAGLSRPRHCGRHP